MTTEKLKEIYCSPNVEILEFINEGTICESPTGTGEDMEWDS